MDHDRHSHLVYALELPREPGEAQRTLRIGSEASYIVAARNPDAPTPPGIAPAARPPALPERLRARFGSRRFAPLDTPEWLDYEGVELVVIGAARAAALSSASSSTPRRSGFTTPTCSEHSESSRTSCLWSRCAAAG